MFESVNPATGEVIARFERTPPDKLAAMLVLASEAQRFWRRLGFDERGAKLLRAAQILRERADTFASVMTAEMGKPIREARAEVEKCAVLCDWVAHRAEGVLSPRPAPSDANLSLVRYDPLGVVLGIMPWNFPMWQVFRFAAPALMAGNAVFLKHAPNVFGCADACETIFEEAGLPEGVFNVIRVPVEHIRKLVVDPGISAVALTGSTRAGSQVAAVAGAAIKPVFLELGGSDAFIVAADADLDAAVDGALRSRFLNTGQSCIAAKRLIIVGPVYEPFVKALVERVNELRLGNPAQEETDIGPLARRDLRDTLARQVAESVATGAELLVGGAPVEGPGYFYQPTVLGAVVPGMRAFDEEVFGPVAVVTQADNMVEAVALANRSDYGLAASIWSRHPDLELAAQLETGSVFFNGIVKSDPRLPFGGVKRSGFGRELGAEGFKAFVNAKTVWVNWG